jgi:hypothetical protein
MMAAASDPSMMADQAIIRFRISFVGELVRRGLCQESPPRAIFCL